MQLLLIRWSVQNKKRKAWFKTVICCWLPFPSPEVRLRRGITESFWHPLVGTVSSHLSRELTVSYHTEGHRNLFLLLNTQDSLCSLCLDWKSSYEGETISHTLGVRCLLWLCLGLSASLKKRVMSERINVGQNNDRENKLCPLLSLSVGRKGQCSLEAG